MVGQRARRACAREPALAAGSTLPCARMSRACSARVPGAGRWVGGKGGARQRQRQEGRLWGARQRQGKAGRQVRSPASIMASASSSVDAYWAAWAPKATLPACSSSAARLQSLSICLSGVRDMVIRIYAWGGSLSLRGLTRLLRVAAAARRLGLIICIPRRTSLLLIIFIHSHPTSPQFIEEALPDRQTGRTVITASSPSNWTNQHLSRCKCQWDCDLASRRTGTLTARLPARQRRPPRPASEPRSQLAPLPTPVLPWRQRRSR